MDKEELATEIVEKILPKYLQYTVFYTEFNEDGSISHVRSERSEAIYKDILKLLEKEIINPLDSINFGRIESEYNETMLMWGKIPLNWFENRIKEQIKENETNI